MEQYLRSYIGVFLAATLTTAGCIAIALVMVYLLFQGQDLNAAMQLAPIISFVTAYPVTFFIWYQVRRNILLRRELQRLVNRDRLTDVATRDFFFAQMNNNPGAYGTSLMVDIDFFKDVNDTYGHMAGDVVITRVARILQQNTRAGDIVCRFGGEEFVIFLAQTGRSDGYELAERMRQAIAQDAIAFHGQEMHVTVSIGGSLKARLDDIDLAIQQADEALYRAKSSGRNRTVFAGRGNATTDNAAA